jgi:hypothetical protein
MSAYLVEPETIAMLADYARRHLEGIDDAQQAARILLRENVLSVAYRYKQPPDTVYRDFTGKSERQYKAELTRWVDDLTGRLNDPNDIDPAPIFAACRQLDYQSCEEPDYYESRACNLIAQIAFCAARHML